VQQLFPCDWVAAQVRDAAQDSVVHVGRLDVEQIQQGKEPPKSEKHSLVQIAVDNSSPQRVNRGHHHLAIPNVAVKFGHILLCVGNECADSGFTKHFLVVRICPTNLGERV
jgi:hypothetical protein